MENNKKKKPNGMGFYVVMCCCVAIIGVMGFVNSKRKEQMQIATPVSEIKTKEPFLPTLPPIRTPDAKPAEAVKVVELPTATPINIQTEKPKNNETDVIESGENTEYYDGDVVESISLAKTPKFKMPTDGEICKGFSGDTLYFDNVLEDYRTHNGIDIATKENADVYAAYSGTIESIYEDTLGKTIVIDHGNGYKTKYSNLDDTSHLNVDDTLNEGDFIAHIGNNKYGESVTEPHLHFEIIKDDIAVDPEKYVK